MTSDLDRSRTVRPPVRSITEQVADALRRRIRDGMIQPGERLGREEDLAREFGVSRPTLRESIRLLSTGGMLRAVKGPGGGIFVQRSPEEALMYSLAEGVSAMLDVRAISLTELLAARISIEVPIAGLAARRITAEGIAELRGIVAELERAPSDEAVQVDGDGRLHRAIARYAGNPVLLATVGWAFDVVQPKLYETVPPPTLAPVIDQLRAIVEAIAARDADGAQAAMRAHLEHLGRVLTEPPTAATPRNAPES